MTARDLDALALERRVEALLASFGSPGSPGCTIGILRDDALVLHRSAGLANIEHGVPIEEDPALAQALSTIEIDEEIPEALYRAVAEVLSFLLKR